MTLPEVFLIMLGLALAAGILSGIPAMLAIAGVPFVMALLGGMVGAFDLGFLNFFPARVYGIMSNPLLMAVPLFVLMGVLLEKSRVSERMLQVLGQMLGGSARGMAVSVLIFSAIIAASTGIVGATVVMLVLMSLPAMLQAGVPKPLAAGLICAGGTLGQIIPPSILLVLLGDQIGNTYLEAQQRAGNFAPDAVSVGDLFAGALLPGLMLVGLYAVYAFAALTLAGRKAPAPLNLAPVTPRPALGVILGSFAPPLLMILAVLGSILAGVATTTEAAGLGAVGALMMAGYHRPGRGRALVGLGALAVLALLVLRLMTTGRAGTAATIVAVVLVALLVLGLAVSVWKLWHAGVLSAATEDTLRITGMVFGIVVAASMLALVFRGFGGEEAAAHLMRGLPGGEWGALFIVMGLVFVLGFLLEAIEIIYIVVPLLGPPLLGGDISPVWFGVLLAMNLQTSFLTPPFGFALFYFRSVAPREITTRDTYLGVAPFVVLQLIGLAIVIAFPSLATWLPGVLF
jgi:TRAP-type mannitol/chloroaromatic compound transport system permease large subunit